MKTVFALIAVLILSIIAATTVMYTSASPAYEEYEVTVSKADIDQYARQ